jgi:hypothetical protein
MLQGFGQTNGLHWGPRSPWGLGFFCTCGHLALWVVPPGYLFCPRCNSYFVAAKVGTQAIGLARVGG